jgi:glycolate oxidase FAD binding subunit
MTPEQRPPHHPFVPPGEIQILQRDMTVICSAEVTLRTVQEQLTPLQQWLAIDGAPDTSIGRLVERDSTGALRLGFGGWRDQMLGVQFLNGKSELITAGGRTMKNVAGYDLTKFMVGGHGIFGKLVTITARSYRLPSGAVHARFAPDAAMVNQLLPTPLKPQWLMLTPEALWCGYLADPAALTFYRSRVAEAGAAEIADRSLAEDVEFRQSAWGRWADGNDTYRASVPLTKIRQFADEASLKEWTADPAFGIVIGRTSPDHWKAIRAAAAAVGGTVLFRRAVDDDQSAAIDISTNPVERQIIERLKHAFDPGGQLAPLPWQTA